MGQARPQVWRIHLDQPHDRRWWDALAPHERERASRFACPEQRRRYTVAHAALRSILARACGVPAAELPFAAEPSGRPYLALPGEPPDFNLSHAGEWALVALVRPPWRVGVDIEQISPDLDWHAMAQRLYHPDEVDALTAAGPFLGRIGYFLLWSAKEAYVKATGTGLPALSHTRVQRSSTEPTRGTIQHSPTAAPWPVRWLAAPPGYTAALVTAPPPPAPHRS